jgi:hypothetical protein
MLHQSRAAVDTTLTDQVYARAYDLYAESTKNKMFDFLGSCATLTDRVEAWRLATYWFASSRAFDWYAESTKNQLIFFLHFGVLLLLLPRS